MTVEKTARKLRLRRNIKYTDLGLRLSYIMLISWSVLDLRCRKRPKVHENWASEDGRSLWLALAAQYTMKQVRT